MPSNIELFRRLYRIRRFETVLLDHFKSGIFPGTTHTSLGQENAVGCWLTRRKAMLWSNHTLARALPGTWWRPTDAVCRINGKPLGVCGGGGGSQHLHWRNFYSSGIQGARLAAGTLAENARQRAIVVISWEMAPWVRVLSMSV